MQFFKPPLRPLGTKRTALFWVITRRVEVINSREGRSSLSIRVRSLILRLGAMFGLRYLYVPVPVPVRSYNNDRRIIQ